MAIDLCGNLRSSQERQQIVSCGCPSVKARWTLLLPSSAVVIPGGTAKVACYCPCSLSGQV